MKTSQQHIALYKIPIGWYFTGLITLCCLSNLFASATDPDSAQDRSYIKAKTFYYDGKLDSSLLFYQYALQQYKQEEDTISLIYVLNDRALVYNDLGNRQEVFSSLDSAFFILEEFGGDSLIKATLLANRAEIYSDIGKGEKTVEAYKNALQLIPEDTVVGLQITANMNLSKFFANQIHLDSTYIDSALYYASNSLEASRAIRDTHFIAKSLVYVATINGFSNYQKASKQSEEAIALFTLSKSKKGLFFARVQSGLVDYVNENYEVAIAKIWDALEQVDESINVDDKKQAYDILYRSYLRLDQYEPALEAYQEYIAIDNELNSTLIRKELVRMEAKYELKKKDLQLAVLNKQMLIDKQKQQFLMLILLLVVVLATVTVLYFRVRTKNRIILEREKNAQLTFDLEAKSRELVTKGLHVAEKNELIKDVLEDISTIKDLNQQDVLRNMQIKLKQNLKAETPWLDFKKSFEEINPEFFSKIRSTYPDLTEREQRLLAFSKIGLNNREVATLLHVEINSIKTARYRLKKKLKLSEDQSIEKFVYQM